MKKSRLILMLIFILIIIGSITLINTIQAEDVENVLLEEQHEWRFSSEVKVRHSVFYSGFRDINHGVTVGYHGATYVTQDAGRTWTKGENEANCRYGLDWYGDDYLWTVGNYGGNRVSLNGGISLLPVTDLPLIDERPNNIVQIIDLKSIWVGSPLNLAFSEDAGYSWTYANLPQSIVEIEGVFMFSNGSGFLVGDTAAVYFTEDSGASWSEVGKIPVVTGIKNTDVPAVSLHFESNQVGKMVYLDKNQQNYAFETKDGGNSWQQVMMPKVERSAPYISDDGETLTLVDSIGRLKIFSWSENSK